jgi:hypothetical protein
VACDLITRRVHVRLALRSRSVGCTMINSHDDSSQSHASVKKLVERGVTLGKYPFF